MKKLRIFYFFLFLSSVISNFSLYATVNKANVINFDTPDKTICIKNPDATDTDKYFSSNTVYYFEIFKGGTSDQLDQIIKLLKKDSAVLSCLKNSLNGDFQAITLTLKTLKSKSWFINQFKKAGLNTIKINNNPIVEVEKM